MKLKTLLCAILASWAIKDAQAQITSSNSALNNIQNSAKTGVQSVVSLYNSQIGNTNAIAGTGLGPTFIQGQGNAVVGGINNVVGDKNAIVGNRNTFLGVSNNAFIGDGRRLIRTFSPNSGFSFIDGLQDNSLNDSGIDAALNSLGNFDPNTDSITKFMSLLLGDYQGDSISFNIIFGSLNRIFAGSSLDSTLIQPGSNGGVFIQGDDFSDLLQIIDLFRRAFDNNRYPLTKALLNGFTIDYLRNLLRLNIGKIANDVKRGILSIVIQKIIRDKVALSSTNFRVTDPQSIRVDPQPIIQVSEPIRVSEQPVVNSQVDDRPSISVLFRGTVPQPISEQSRISLRSLRN